MEESAAYQGSDSLDYDLCFLGNYPTAVVAFHGRLSWQTKEEKKDGELFPAVASILPVWVILFLSGPG